MRLIFTFFGILVSFLVGCSPSGQNSSEISDQIFVEVLVSVVQLHKVYEEHPDSLTNAREDLFEHYGVNREMLESYIRKMEGRPEAWEPIFSEAKAILDLESKGSSNQPRSRIGSSGK